MDVVSRRVVDGICTHFSESIFPSFALGLDVPIGNNLRTGTWVDSSRSEISFLSVIVVPGIVDDEGLTWCP